jgi:hypothetical protein
MSNLLSQSEPMVGGELKKNLPSPPDIIRNFYTDGSFYMGNTLNGKPHGIGRVYKEDGTLVMACEWENGNPVVAPLRFKYA